MENLDLILGQPKFSNRLEAGKRLFLAPMRTVCVSNQKAVDMILKRADPQFEDFPLVEVGKTIYEHADQKTLAAY